MFAGERTWPSGALADAVLDRMVRRSENDWRLPMPVGVVDLLRACFRHDPAARPRSMGEVASTLADIAGRELSLPATLRPPQPSILDQIHERRLASGGSWDDPRRWLHLAYQVAGLDPRDATPFWPTDLGGRRAQALADLRALAEARRVLDQLADAPDIRFARARIRGEIARIELSLGDASDAIASLRAAAALIEDGDNGDLLVSLLIELAISLREHGEVDAALDAHDRSIAAASALGADSEALRGHASALLAKANTMMSVAPQAVLDLYNLSIVLHERAGDEVGAARSIAAKAGFMHSAGDSAQAAELWDLADQRLRALDTTGRADLVATRGRLTLNRSIGASSPEEQLRHGQAAVNLLAPLVRDQGWHELAADLGKAYWQVARTHESLDQPRQALAGYRAAREMFTDAVVRDGRTELSDQLARSYDHESTLVRNVEDPRAGATVATRAVELWQRLAEIDGLDEWAEQLATAKEKLAAALIDAGEADAARAQLDEILRLFPEPEARTPAVRRLVAMAHRGHGVLLRKAGNPRAAYERYQHALAMLGDGGGPEQACARVLILESISAALGDAGHHENSLRALDESIAVLEPLVEQGHRAPSQLAGSYQRLANGLLQLGDFRSADEAAVAALERYDQLIAAGRDHLTREAARLRAAYGVIRHRLSDVDGAIAEVTAARAVFADIAGTDEQLSLVVSGLDRQLADLRELATTGPTDLARRLAERRSRLERAATVSAAGERREASLMIEAIIGDLGWLRQVDATEEVYALLGQAGMYLGVTAMAAGRNGAAHHGMATAIESYRTLVVDGELTRYLEDWANAYIGLASLFAHVGDDGRAAEWVDELEQQVGEVDPANAANWRMRAEHMVSSMRASPGP